MSHGSTYILKHETTDILNDTQFNGTSKREVLQYSMSFGSFVQGSMLNLMKITDSEQL